ncbi:MAG: hypothetical protein AAB605_02250 [Patescibacteria group bacterium]
MKRLTVLLCALTALPLVALSQEAVIVIERWTIVQYGEVARDLKPLPPGYQHFAPVSAEVSSQRYSSDGVVVCSTEEQAISFGKRLGPKFLYTPEKAYREVNRLNHDTLCGYVNGRIYTPIEYAIRGDDVEQKILLIKVVDEYGHIYYLGTPYKT